jgi:tRNA(His) 5'-end guanylyltransferase
LIFAPDDNLIYSGRIQKLTSLAASFASMKFNELIRETLSKLYTEKEGLMRVRSASVELSKEYDKINNKVSFLETKIGRAFFDARVFQVPDKTEAFNSLLWRTRDCERNSKNVFAQSILSHKECQNKTSNELVEICEELGHFWSDIPDKYKYGILWKKETYLKQPENPELEPCFRTRFIQIIKRLNYSDENVEMVLCNKL